ncbi:ATP-dependent helicase [Natronospora cellulosivora (SeqCode)]
MIKLRPGQIEVAEYRGGKMAVPAVPGAGKTTVLAYLAAELIEQGYTGKGKILIVTYMNSAVANFRSRIGDYLEAKGLSRNRGYEVRTLHSLALNILKEKPEFLLINDDFKIIDPDQKGRILREIFDEWVKDNIGIFFKYFDSDYIDYNRAREKWRDKDFPNFIDNMISQFKTYGLNKDDVYALQGKAVNDSYLDWAFSIYAKYDKKMKHNGFLDFDDLISYSLELLEKDDLLLERLQGKYSFIFEDEAQDSNLRLNRILSLLSKKSGNLARVGDSNQAIMGTFTAANPILFRKYTDSKDVNKRSILYSSRSSEDIIDFANYLVKWTVNEHPVEVCRKALEEKYIYPVDENDPFPNPETEGYTIACNSFSTSKKEIEMVSKFAQSHLDDNPENTVAILLPSKYIIGSVIENLEKLDIEYECMSDQIAERLVILKDFKKIIYYLAEPHKKANLIKVLEEILLSFLIEEGDELEFLDRIFEKYSAEELIYPIGGELRLHEYLDHMVDDNLMSSLLDSLERLSLWIDASVKLPPDELVLFLAEQLDLKEEELALAQNIALEIKIQLDENPHWKLHEIADQLPRLEDSFKNFARNIYDRKGFEPAPGKVTITTYHKSKGLEWDTVFLTNLSDNNFPSSLDDKFRSEYYYLKDGYSNPAAVAKANLENLINEKYQDDPQREANLEFINERLRLLYVGITRAKRNLMLTAHREVIYDNGNSKDVNEALPFLKLQEFAKNASGRLKSK